MTMFKQVLCLFLIGLLAACGGGSGGTLNENRPPVAVFTMNSEVSDVGYNVALDARESNDPDKHSINYQWQITSPRGKVLALSELNTVLVNFNVNEVGIYKVKLTVTDAEGASHSEQKNLNVTSEPTQNKSPTAVISTKDSVKQHDKITLSGKDSQLYADTDFHWEILEKPLDSKANVTSSVAVETYFTADKAGLYKVRLTLTDTDNNTALADSVITATSIVDNSAPVVEITTTHTEVNANQELILSSTANDPDGDTLNFNWAIVKQPNQSQFSLTEHTTSEAKFSSNHYGEYTVELTVDDNNLSVKKLFSFSVVAVNQAPIASINFNQEGIKQGETVNIYGIGTDSEGETLDYAWSLVSKPTGSTTDIGNSTHQNISLYFDLEGDYLVSLEVSDHNLTSEPKTLLIRAAKNHPPYITTVDYNRNSSVGALNQLTINAGDIENDTLTYKWELKEKPIESGVTVNDLTTRTIEFTPDIIGWYLFDVNVHDGIQWAEVSSEFVIIVR